MGHDNHDVHKNSGHEYFLGVLFDEKSELTFSILCGGFLLLGVVLEKWSSASEWFILVLLIIAYAFGGFFTAREAITEIRRGRFEIDFLMLVAAAGAAALGKWHEGALLLFLFSMGHALEHYAMGRARRAIEALAELAPKSALVRRDKELLEVPVEELVLGDVAIIKPDERIPADGFVLQGHSSVDQAPITGESVPVDKLPVEDPSIAVIAGDDLPAVHRLFAGSINQRGAMEMHVTRLSGDTALARVVQMVNEAEAQRSPTQLFADKFQRTYVPCVLALVGLLLFAWVVIDESFSASFYRAMAVLVAASPCALAISTPSAVLSGVARAARGGVLIKGGAPLENLGKISAIAFDKTGTLTEGNPRLVDVVTADASIREGELLEVAVAVEMLSDHPLAAAVVRDGQSRLGHLNTNEATNIQSITGRGVKAMVDDEVVYIGKDNLFDEVSGDPLSASLQAKVDDLEANGRTTMIVRQGSKYLGVLGLMDTPRVSAKPMIARLRALGVERMIMISGDNQKVANAVAAEVGIDDAWGDLMPADKVTAIKELRANGVAMVGDGVNDAPAMANATVGIAMGAAGSDVALETADVALMADDLDNLPFAVGLSRKTSRVIQQNVWISLGMVAVLVPATMSGLNIGLAVFFHEGSTILVVLNALRLLVYKESAD